MRVKPGLRPVLAQIATEHPDLAEAIRDLHAEARQAAEDMAREVYDREMGGY